MFANYVLKSVDVETTTVTQLARIVHLNVEISTRNNMCKGVVSYQRQDNKRP